MADENVALLVNAPNLSAGSAGSTYSSVVGPLLILTLIMHTSWSKGQNDFIWAVLWSKEHQLRVKTWSGGFYPFGECPVMGNQQLLTGLLLVACTT